MRGGRGVGDVGYLPLGQETLDKVPQWSSLLREEGEGPDSRCWESWLQVQVQRGPGDVERFSHGRLVSVGPRAQPRCLTFIMWMNGPT